MTASDIRVHYQGLLALHPLSAETDCAAEVIRLARSWVKSKEREKEHVVNALGRGWLSASGDWRDRGSSVQVRIESGDRDSASPQFWALRYEEVCVEERYRRWRTDLGISRLLEGDTVVAVRVSHYLMPEFIGDEPEPPLATSPKLVKSILQDRRWVARAGTELLRTAPERIGLGGVPRLVERMEDGARAVPIIVISALPEERGFTLDPKSLAWGAAGAATVYTLSSAKEVTNEANYYIPYEYRCTNGFVRIYLPGVNINGANDFRRHRFFTPAYVEQRGADAVAAMVYRGLARRAVLRLGDEVLDVDDVMEKKLDHERRQLRASLQGAAAGEDIAAQRELVAFVIEDNDRLEAEVAERQRLLDETKARIDQLETDVLIDLESHDDQVAQLEYRVAESNQRANRLDSELRAAVGTQAVLEALDQFPDDLVSVLRLIGQLYPSRVVILDEAYESATGGSFAADKGWRVLRAIATHLHALHFEHSGGDIAGEFTDRSGFDLAMSEKKLTKENKQAMRQRSRTYKGRDIDITPHVKVGTSKPNLLRVHYYADQEAKVIVIGHCGDHLDTAGTRKNK